MITHSIYDAFMTQGKNILDLSNSDESVLPPPLQKAVDPDVSRSEDSAEQSRPGNIADSYIITTITQLTRILPRKMEDLKHLVLLYATHTLIKKYAGPPYTDAELTQALHEAVRKLFNLPPEIFKGGE